MASDEKESRWSSQNWWLIVPVCLVIYPVSVVPLVIMETPRPPRMD